MKRYYISILLASFQIFYYLGWVSYSNNSEIDLIKTDTQLRSENFILSTNEVEMNYFMELNSINDDTIAIKDFEPARLYIIPTAN